MGKEVVEDKNNLSKRKMMILIPMSSCVFLKSHQNFEVLIFFFNTLIARIGTLGSMQGKKISLTRFLKTKQI